MIIQKEVRKKSVHMFCCCCCRNNTVVHLDNPRSISACVQQRTQKSATGLNSNKKKHILSKKISDRRDKYSRISHYRTPVLFATSEGLHLRTVDDRLEGSYCFSDTGRHSRVGGKGESWPVEPRFLCEFCDVALIVSTPTESIGHPQHGIRWRSLPVLAEDSLAFAEKDLHVSDNLTADTTDKSVGQRNNNKEVAVEKIGRGNSRNGPISDSRTETRVRFAQTVCEIPLSESGVWSAPEDHASVEQPPYYKRKGSSYAAVNPFRTKPKVNVADRSRGSKLS
jgi:hypothetical protein